MNQTIVYILLAVAVLIFVFSFVKDFFASKKNKPDEKNTGRDTSITLPLQLQAYERLVLLMERISPENLISRINQRGMDARNMQLLLVQTIKTEFEYNLAQQIYVSTNAWDAVKNVKEQLINLINQIAAQLPEHASGNELNKQLLELVLKSNEQFPTQVALNILNSEAKKLLHANA